VIMKTTESMFKMTFPSSLNMVVFKNKSYTRPEVTTEEESKLYIAQRRSEWRSTPSYGTLQFLKTRNEDAKRISMVSGNVWAVIMFGVFSFLMTSCNSNHSLAGSTGARGDIKITAQKQDNYQIKIAVSNLAQPASLNPPKQTYVAWMITDNNMTKRLGQVKISNAVISRNLTASLETESFLKPTRVFLTAEEDEDTTYPASQVVYWSRDLTL
jgi:hypothetical protein